MSFKRISILILAILAIATGVMFIMDKTATPPAETSPAPSVAQTPPGNAQPTPAKPAKQPPPPPVVRSTPPQAAPMPEIAPEDEEQTEKEEMEAALAQLNSPDPLQRLEGAETLGAYPTKEAEMALTQLLNGDTEAEVRIAAAQSLGYVEKPTDDTITALMAALDDQNEEVRASALSSLEDYLAGSDEGSKRYKKIDAGLRAKQQSRGTPQDIKDAIRDITQDQQETQ